MMNKDNYWLQMGGSSATKNPPPQAGVGCFLLCTPQKRAFIAVINQRAVCFPHTQPHTMAILIVNVENNFYLCI